MASRPPGDIAPAISAERAAELAVAFVRRHTSYKDIGGNFHGERLSDFDKEHGDIIDFRTLRVGPRVYLPDTPYEPVTDSVPEYVRLVYEAHYLVPLYSSRGVETMIVSVPARDLGYNIDDRGQMHPRGGFGAMSLMQTVVSAGTEYDMPLSPECAIRLTAEASGRRVALPPQAVHPGRPFHPSVLFWKLTLDEPVDAALSGIEVRERVGTMWADSIAGHDTVRVLYVGLEPRNRGDRSTMRPVWFRASPKQPSVDTLPYEWLTTQVPAMRRASQTMNARTANAPSDTIFARVRRGFAMRFERIRLPRAPEAPPTRHRPCEAASGANVSTSPPPTR